MDMGGTGGFDDMRPSWSTVSNEANALGIRCRGARRARRLGSAWCTVRRALDIGA
jgi:hypothetical protein